MPEVTIDITVDEIKKLLPRLTLGQTKRFSEDAILSYYYEHKEMFDKKYREDQLIIARLKKK